MACKKNLLEIFYEISAVKIQENSKEKLQRIMLLLKYTYRIYPFKRQSHKIVEHTRLNG